MSSHFSDRKRWASTKVKAEVIPEVRPYVPEEHPFDKPEDWREPSAAFNKVKHPLGPTKEQAEAHQPLREAALKKLREDSIALAKVHLDGIDELHKQYRVNVDPKIRPNKPMKKDITHGGLRVFGISMAIFVLLVLLRFLYIWKKAK